MLVLPEQRSALLAQCRLHHRLTPNVCCCRYFHYTGFRLPIIYNTNTDKGLVNKGGKLLTPGGAAPIVLHFANRKPWELPTDDKLYKLANRCVMMV